MPRDPDPTLDSLGKRHNTDKASTWCRRRSVDGERSPGHDYLVKYQHFLAHLRYRPGVRFLELGAGPEWNCGASARMWEEFFPEAERIAIAEIRPDATAIATDLVEVIIGDLGDAGFLKQLAGSEWDVILDDASHLWNHQLQSTLALLPAVKPGGIFVLEDIQTSFGEYRDRYGGPDEADSLGFRRQDRPDPMRVLSEVAHHLVGGDQHPTLEASTISHLTASIAVQLDSITFVRDSAVMVKRSDDGAYLGVPSDGTSRAVSPRS